MMTTYSDTLHWEDITPIFDHYWSGPYYQIWLLPNCARFPLNICNRCGMPTEDAYSSVHLVVSHFGTCICSNVETHLSWSCLVSVLLNFEHPSVLLFCIEEAPKQFSMSKSKRTRQNHGFLIRTVANPGILKYSEMKPGAFGEWIFKVCKNKSQLFHENLFHYSPFNF